MKIQTMYDKILSIDMDTCKIKRDIYYYKNDELIDNNSNNLNFDYCFVNINIYSRDNNEYLYNLYCAMVQNVDYSICLKITDSVMRYIKKHNNDYIYSVFSIDNYIDLEMKRIKEYHYKRNTNMNNKKSILFRGKCFNCDENDWIYGNLLDNWNNTNSYFINPKGTKDIIEVKLDTISQYTMKDSSNKKKIFEGDIVMLDYCQSYGIVQSFDDNFLYILFEDEYIGAVLKNDLECYVIGNKWDTPYLLNHFKSY